MESYILLSSPINRGIFRWNKLWLDFPNLFVTVCTSGSTAKHVCSLQTTNEVHLNVTLENVLTASHRCGHSSLCVLSLWAACNTLCTCKPNWLRIDVHYGRQIGFISMFTVGARYMYACVCLLAVPLAFESLFLAGFDRVVEVSKIIKCSSSFLHFSQLTAGVLLLSSLIFHPSHANCFIIQRSL